MDRDYLAPVQLSGTRRYHANTMDQQDYLNPLQDNPYDNYDTGENIYSDIADNNNAPQLSRKPVPASGPGPGPDLKGAAGVPDAHYLPLDHKQAARPGPPKPRTGTTGLRVTVGLLTVLCLASLIGNGVLVWQYQQCQADQQLASSGHMAAHQGALVNSDDQGQQPVSSEPAGSGRVVVSVPPVPDQSGDCGPDFVPADQDTTTCYLVSTQSVPRSQAEQTCTARSGHLLRPGSSGQDDQFVRGLLDSTTAGTNIALSSAGARCSASSEWSAEFGCLKAIDGDTSPVTSEWVISQGPAVGSWIRVDFGATHEVYKVQLMTRCYNGYQSKGYNLEFEDGSSVTGELQKANGGNREQCSGVTWQTKNFPARLTSFVKVKITSVYTDGYNGFREIRVFGRSSGIGYWTDVTHQNGAWRTSESSPVASISRDQTLPLVATDGTCLTLSSQGYYGSWCGGAQTRRFVCVKNV